MALIEVNIPTIRTLGGIASHVAIGRGFPQGKSLEIVQEKVKLSGSDIYLGVPALTELQLRYEGKVFVLNDCIMTVSQEKNIVQTALQGRDGTVKEYISDGDYSISVMAAIDNDYLLSGNQQFQSFDGYPISELKLFSALLRAKEAIEVTSDWLDLFGIKTIVIKSYNFDQETYSNRQNFTMQMLSDLPFEIKLLQNA